MPHKEYSATMQETIADGKIYGNAREHLREFRILDYKGGSNEVGSPTTTLRKKASRGLSLNNPDGV